MNRFPTAAFINERVEVRNLKIRELGPHLRACEAKLKEAFKQFFRLNRQIFLLRKMLHTAVKHKFVQVQHHLQMDVSNVYETKMRCDRYIQYLENRIAAIKKRLDECKNSSSNLSMKEHKMKKT
ncbi:hypothetical protein CDAR_206831 [Caerostris darwini]|uniref:Uncharacterized protein n=1 Tax=Caerostris darwini TaxID=1538125 RepID=A0AAV4UL89_9ARAC|nr:hypothetical protein CDAR_206831 [Caerostris darwini]